MIKNNVSVLDINIKPQVLFSALLNEQYPVFLDGRKSSGARKSIITCNPVSIVRSKENITEIWTIKKNKWERSSVSPLNVLRDILNKRKISSTQSELYTGAIGYIAYDFARQLESLPNKNKSDVPNNDVCFGIYNTVLVFDHALNKWYKNVHENVSEEENIFWERILKNYSSYSYDSKVNANLVKTNLTSKQFSQMVIKAKEYILAGDIFQVNLSQRIELELSSHPYGFYNRLVEINPSPFSAFLRFGDITIGSCSPERLFSFNNNRVETRPIAGTRPRGKTLQEDSDMYRELISSEKERAEHLMMVDLERNDIGRVCEYGSVKVEEFMVRESYSHVWHIVSNITGKIMRGKDTIDVITAMFPGGTITGAPKVRTMEIIEELEPVRRGVYTGSIGYITDDGRSDFNIVIRTFVVDGKKAYIQVGAGIVADSDPIMEYKETYNKASALLKAAGVNV